MDSWQSDDRFRCRLCVRHARAWSPHKAFSFLPSWELNYLRYLKHKVHVPDTHKFSSYLTQGTPVNAVRFEKYIEGAVWPECSLFIAAGTYSNRCACEGWTHTSLTMKLLIQPVNESCSMNKLLRSAATCSATVITGGQQLYGNNQAVALYCSSLQTRRKPKAAANMHTATWLPIARPEQPPQNKVTITSHGER